MKSEWIVLTSSYACSCSHGTCWIDASSYKVRIFLIPQTSSISNFVAQIIHLLGFLSVIGGFRAQGRTAVRARSLLDDALRLQDAGCFAVVLECIPGNVAAAITETLEIPTIGIGAGGGTSGQVLVFHDMLGMLSHPQHEQFVPRFCKKYAQVGHAIQDALKGKNNICLFTEEI